MKFDKGVAGKVFSMVAMMAGSLMVSGCGALQMAATSGQGGTPVQGVAISGEVHGGQFPVVGSTIQMYAVGNTGYGSAATPLLTISVTTGANGVFSFTPADWSCTPGTDIYLTATGGNESTLTATNPYAANIAALGDCSNINANSYIIVNEVTTVAAVWALQQFIKIVPGTSLLTQPGTAAGVTPAVAPAFSIGSPTTNVQGLQNAFEVAAVLANTTDGGTPGYFSTAYSGPGTQANRVLTVETWHINTIGDILASCINSTPTLGSTTCSTLATSVTPSGTAPADTLQIAYEMATNPSYNVANTFTYVPSSGPPFQPTDSAVADWTLAYGVAYNYSAGNGANDYTVLNTNDSPAVDSYGNIWLPNTGHSYSYLTSFVTELDPAGNYVATYTNYLNGTGASQNFAVGVSGNFVMPMAIDPSGNVWTEDSGNSTLVRIAAAGGAGVASAGPNYGISTGTSTLTGTAAMASDAAGDIYLTLGGAGSYSSTFGAASNKGLAVLVPNITGTPTVLTAGTGSTVSATSSFTYGAMAVTQSLSGTYGGGGFLYNFAGATDCSGVCTGALSTDLNMYFTLPATVSGSGSSTTIALGQATPATNIINVPPVTATGTFAASVKIPNVSQTYNSTGYTNIPAINTVTGIAVDSSDNLWAVNAPASAVVSGFPQYYVTELVPTYATNPSTGALVASFTPSLFTAAILSGTSGGATSTFVPTKTGFIDGANNFWINSNIGGSVVPVNATSGVIDGAAAFTATVGSNSWSCAGYCGGTNSASYNSRRNNYLGTPSGMTLDLSGNVWRVGSSSGANQVQVIVGVAAPAVMPLSLAAKNHTFGTKP